MSAGEGLDLARLRAETPGCATVLHLNNAGAALQPRPVYEAVTAHLAREYATGGYEARDEAAGRIEAAYASVARLLGAAPDEIAIVENATRALDMGFHAIPFAPGDVVYTSVAEYASNYLAYLRAREQAGIAIRVVPNDAHGQLDVAALDALLADPGPGRRARLVAVSHVPTQSGLVQPAAAIGAAAKRHGALYLLDATQSAGQLPLDVDDLGCDLLCSTGRKYLRGPRGVGFLYVRRAVLPDLQPPFIDLHAARWTTFDAYEWRPDARRFENWESNIAATLGLGAAVDYALALGVERTWPRVRALAAWLRDALRAVPGVTVQDRGETLCGIVTFTAAGRDPEDLKAALRRRADRPDGTTAARPINVTTSTTASSLFDFAARDVISWVRASVHYYNTEGELAEFVEAVGELAVVSR
ncbi:MAG TPA: aminotransferase class V-fold PLP-dependent enzyme [Thermomicrobiales bacterium]|nr:aminotransferase class V-fold PLP-dependent enzyme [Thermomicrobiales bacterium]